MKKVKKTDKPLKQSNQVYEKNRKKKEKKLWNLLGAPIDKGKMQKGGREKIEVASKIPSRDYHEATSDKKSLKK